MTYEYLVDIKDEEIPYFFSDLMDAVEFAETHNGLNVVRYVYAPNQDAPIDGREVWNDREGLSPDAN